MSGAVDNPPAFLRPMEATQYGDWQIHDYGDQGMSLRDYFAAAAMSAIVSHPECRNRESPSITRDAYQIADTMLKARQS